MIRPLRLLPLIGLLLASVAVAQPPSVALDYVSTASLENEATVERWMAELRRRQIGLSGSVAFDPTLAYVIDDPDPAEFEFFFTSDLGIDYRYDAVNILSARRDLVRAQQRYADQRRRDIETALLNHAELLRARNFLRIEEFDLANEQTTFATAQESFEVDQISQGQLDFARLNLASDQAALERAQVRLERARSDAVSRGLGTSPSFEVLQFVLPEPAPEQTFEYQLLMTELLLADARGLQSSAFGVLENVSVGANYEFDSYNFGANINLNRGRPGAGVDAGFDFPIVEEDPYLEIFVTFDIRVDDRTPSDFTNAERNIADAQGNLEEYLARFAVNAERERQNVDFRWQDLQRALLQLDVNQTRIVELEALLTTLPGEVEALQTEVEALRTRRDAATGEDRTDLDNQFRATESLLRDTTRELQNAQRDLTNNTNGLPRSFDTLYGEWGDYIRAVENYLGLVDGDWVLPE